MKFRLFLLENKGAINQATAILRKKQIKNPEEKREELLEILGKNNAKYLPLAAFFYDESRINFHHVIQDFVKIANLFTINVTNKNVIIKHNEREYKFDSSDESWQKFEHFVHSVLAQRKDNERISLLKKGQRNAGKLIAQKNGIEVRLARDTWDAIVLGQGTSFCISQPGTPHFNSYRLQQKLTTYFIFDDNFPKEHPLHIVVYMVGENRGVVLTDLENETGTIQHPYREKNDRGNYTEEYKRYLKEHGIDVDSLLVSIPLSEEEKEIIERFSKQIDKLSEFKKLSAQEKLNYLTMGHMLTDSQARYLVRWVKEHPYDYPHMKVLHHYFYTGAKIPDDVIPSLKNMKFNKTNLLKHYLKYRKEFHNELFLHGSLEREEYYRHAISKSEFKLLSEKDKQNLVLNGELLRERIREIRKKEKGKSELEIMKELAETSRKIYVDSSLVQWINQYPPQEQIKIYQYINITERSIEKYIYLVSSKEVVKYLLGQLSYRLIMDEKVKLWLKEKFDEQELKDMLPYYFYKNQYFTDFVDHFDKETQKQIYLRIIENDHDVEELIHSIHHIKDKDVLLFVVDKIIEQRKYLIPLDVIYKRLSDLPTDVLKNMVKNGTYLDMFASFDNSNQCKFLQRIFHNDEELLEYVKQRWYTISNVTERIAALLLTCPGRFDESFIKKAVHEMVKLLKETNKEKINYLEKLILSNMLPEDSFQELLSVRHPAVEYVVFSMLLHSINWNKNLDIINKIPEDTIIRAIQRYATKFFGDDYEQKYENRFGIKDMIYLFFSYQSNRPKIIEFLVDFILNQSKLAYDIIETSYSYISSEFNIFGKTILSILASENRRRQLYELSKMIYYNKNLLLYLKLLEYYASHQWFAAIDSMYLPQQFDKLAKSFAYNLMDNNVFDIPVPKIHQWLLRIAKYIVYESSNKSLGNAEYVVDKIAQNANKILVSVQDLADFVLLALKVIGMDYSGFELLKRYNKKYELYQIIRHSRQFNTQELMYFAHILGV